MSAALDSLTAQVTQNTTVEESAVTLINGLAAQIVAAGTDPAALAALTTSLTKSAGDLTAAIVANTPAAATATPANIAAAVAAAKPAVAAAKPKA